MEWEEQELCGGERRPLRMKLLHVGKHGTERIRLKSLSKYCGVDTHYCVLYTIIRSDVSTYQHLDSTLEYLEVISQKQYVRGPRRSGGFSWRLEFFGHGALWLYLPG